MAFLNLDRKDLVSDWISKQTGQLADSPLRVNLLAANLQSLLHRVNQDQTWTQESMRATLQQYIHIPWVVEGFRREGVTL